MISIRISGATREINRMSVMVGGQLRLVTRGQIFVGDALRTFFIGADDIGLVINGFPNGFGQTSTITTSEAVATVDGGIGPFSYQWSLVSTDFGTPLALAPNNARTAFLINNLQEEQSATATFRCVVTDSLGTTAQDDVFVSFSRFSFQ